PLYREVVKTYFRPAGFEVLELPYGPDGRTDLSALEEMNGLAGLAVQSPNFFGIIEDLETASRKAHEKGALSISVFTEPLAFGLIKSPGSQGVDVACGEGQSLGIPQSFGGPGLGIFAARMKYVRAVPGRLVGETKDSNGRRGYVLTLATREQHIRREKAVSNICTNNSLCALAAAMYLAALGGSGLRELAILIRDKAEYLKSELLKAGAALTFTGPTFNEFVAELPGGAYERLLKKNIVAGLPLVRYYPELEDRYLLCVTETKTRQDMDLLVRELGS
ncbi:MAG: glycine dehydrogenase, partial [Pseudomonadota bacterium]